MKKFEYTTAEVSESWLDLLMDMGMHGWELCGFRSVGIAYFKRELAAGHVETESPSVRNALWDALSDILENPGSVIGDAERRRSLMAIKDAMAEHERSGENTVKEDSK